MANRYFVNEKSESECSIMLWVNIIAKNSTVQRDADRPDYFCESGGMDSNTQTIPPFHVDTQISQNPWLACWQKIPLKHIIGEATSAKLIIGASAQWFRFDNKRCRRRPLFICLIAWPACAHSQAIIGPPAKLHRIWGTKLKRLTFKCAIGKHSFAFVDVGNLVPRLNNFVHAQFIWAWNLSRSEILNYDQ